MADRSQYLNDAEESLRLALDGRQGILWTSLPAIIVDYDLADMTISAQPTIQGKVTLEDGTTQYVSLPVLVKVPICYPSGGGFTLTYPFEAGDEVLIVFSSRCIDSWWQSGGIGKPMESRMHDLSDGFAIPGPRSLPNVTQSINGTDMQLRMTGAGGPIVSICADGKVGLENDVTSLNLLLTELNVTLSAFMATLSGFAGGALPVTQAMLQAPAATAVTGLTSVLTKIGALLKP